MKHLTESGPLGQTIKAAVGHYLHAREVGASKDEAAKDLEKTLRVAWPQERGWKYLCETCRDHGAIYHDCPGDATCGRVRPHLPHDYVTPCRCAWGRRLKPKMVTDPDDVTDAGSRGRRRR